MLTREQQLHATITRLLLADLGPILAQDRSANIVDACASTVAEIREVIEAGRLSAMLRGLHWPELTEAQTRALASKVFLAILDYRPEEPS